MKTIRLYVRKCSSYNNIIDTHNWFSGFHNIEGKISAIVPVANKQKQNTAVTLQHCIDASAIFSYAKKCL